MHTESDCFRLVVHACMLSHALEHAFAVRSSLARESIAERRRVRLFPPTSGRVDQSQSKTEEEDR